MPNENAKHYGALWLNESRGGVKYFSGYVGEDRQSQTKVVIFKNNKKRDGKKDPDYLIYLDRPAEQRQETPPPQNDSDIPF